MSVILLLCGAKVKDEPIVTPDKSEPYHIIWNPNFSSQDQDTYMAPSDLDGYASKVYSLEPLTDYDPLPEWPSIHSPSSAPLQSGLASWNVLAHYRTPPYSPLVIKDPHLFAHPDRRGQLPKEFQIRFGIDTAIPNMDLMKYKLNSSGSRFIAIEIKASDINQAEIMGRIRVNLTGSEETTPFVSLGHISGKTSDNINLIIFDDRLSIIRGLDDEAATIHLTQPIELIGEPTIELFVEHNPSATQTDYHFLDSFMINDAYW